MASAFSRGVASSLVVALSSACVSSTVIKSVPPGAKVYIDGSPVGHTPYTMSDTKIVGSRTDVKLRLDGYEEFNGVITRSEEFDAGACIGGLLVLVPFLWIQGYRPERTFELTPLRYPPGYGPHSYPAYPPGYYPPPQGYPPPPQGYPAYPPGYYPPPQGYAPPPPGYAPPPQGNGSAGTPQQQAPPPQAAPAPQPPPATPPPPAQDAPPAPPPQAPPQ